MEKELNPCFHCGGEAGISGSYPNIWLECPECGMRTPKIKATEDRSAHDELKELWNRMFGADKPATEDVSTGSWNGPPPTIGELSDMLKSSIYEILDSLPYEDEKRLEMMRGVVAVMREVIEFEKYADCRQS